VIKRQAEGVRMLAEVNQVLQKALQTVQQNGFLDPPGRGPSEPREPRFKLWRNFALYWQGIERSVRRDHSLLPEDRLPKEMACADSGYSHRMLTYYMKGYGLRPEQWPPSTWNPEQERAWHRPNATKKSS
jgi:hypothetical protein